MKLNNREQQILDFAILVGTIILVFIAFEVLSAILNSIQFKYIWDNFISFHYKILRLELTYSNTSFSQKISFRNLVKVYPDYFDLFGFAYLR